VHVRRQSPALHSHPVSQVDLEVLDVVPGDVGDADDVGVVTSQRARIRSEMSATSTPVRAPGSRPIPPRPDPWAAHHQRRRGWPSSGRQFLRGERVSHGAHVGVSERGRSPVFTGQPVSSRSAWNRSLRGCPGWAAARRLRSC
jgi:hypothetical protein